MRVCAHACVRACVRVCVFDTPLRKQRETGHIQRNTAKRPSIVEFSQLYH